MVRCITCNVLHMRQFCRFLYCLAWLDTVEFNRLPCPKNEMYDDAVFGDRFHYQLTVWNSCIDMAISILSCSYCICNRYWQNHRSILPNFLLSHALIRLNSVVGDLQPTRCTMIWFSMIDSDISWLCLKCVYSRGYLDSLILILHMK